MLACSVPDIRTPHPTLIVFQKRTLQNRNRNELMNSSSERRFEGLSTFYYSMKYMNNGNLELEKHDVRELNPKLS